MGVVIHDPDPERHSHPDWVAPDAALYESRYGKNYPIFILFKEVVAGEKYEPYQPAIEAMMETIFSHGWGFDPRLPEIHREIRMSQVRSWASQL